MTSGAPELRPVELLDRLPERLAADFEQRLDVVERASRRVRRGDDSEAIHDLRVGIRRLSAALAAWEPLLRPGPRARARRMLRRVRQALGPAREAEVLLADLEPRLRAATPADRLVTVDVLRRLERRVLLGRTRAIRLARNERLERIARRVRRSADDLSERLGHRPSIVLEGMQWLAKVGTQALRACDDAAREPEDAVLHRARIALKKWRYAAECFAAVGIPTASPEPGVMRVIQEALGEVHDRAALRERLVSEIERPRYTADSARRDALRSLAGAVESERTHALTMFLERFESLKASGAPENPPVEIA
jgi:CHAD domain-containing protein